MPGKKSNPSVIRTAERADKEKRAAVHEKIRYQTNPHRIVTGAGREVISPIPGSRHDRDMVYDMAKWIYRLYQQRKESGSAHTDQRHHKRTQKQMRFGKKATHKR